MADKQRTSGIENTAQRDPLMHLMGALGDSDSYITGMEAVGQRQLVASTMLPTKRTDHSMWSKVVDQHGRPRLTVFYKAAFYDRDAFINVQTVSGYAFDVVNGEPLVLDDTWATAAAMREAVQELRDDNAERHAAYPSDYKAEQIAKADTVLASLPGGDR